MVRQDVYMMMVAGPGGGLVVRLSFKEWKLYLFDPDFARGLGYRIG